jgi:hypothetical protein
MHIVLLLLLAGAQGDPYTATISDLLCVPIRVLIKGSVPNFATVLKRSDSEEVAA